MVLAFLDLISPLTFKDLIKDDNFAGFNLAPRSNEMQTRGSQTRNPTAGSTRKRDCATFSYLGDADSPPPEALSLLDINGPFDGYSLLFVGLLRLSIR